MRLVCGFIMILIRTHHKTGTVWMLRVFMGIADKLNLRFCNLQEGFIPSADLYLSPHAPFPNELTEGNFRGLHLIRDPRDVVLSGMHYHRRSTEEWLCVPESEYGGLSYQEKLNSLDDDERLYFEMQYAGYATTRDMLDWDYDDSRFLEMRYEDLIGMSGRALFNEALRFIGFSRQDLDWGTEMFTQNSLFTMGFKTPPDDPHIRSGRPAQWRTEFRRRHGRRFLEILGDSLIRLGYERDNNWVEQLPE